MKEIVGPFAADPNVATPTLLVDDRLWCFIRRAHFDVSGLAQYGVIEFEDVRTYRCRMRTNGEHPDCEDTPASNWWALQLDSSAYAAQCAASDVQRSAAVLGGHSHFVVVDGNHRAIDVYARSVSVRSVDGPLVIDIKRLVEDERSSVPS